MISERIDAITRISAAYMGTVIPAPRSVKIEITATCTDVIIAHEQHGYKPDQDAVDGALRD